MKKKDLKMRLRDMEARLKMQVKANGVLLEKLKAARKEAGFELVGDPSLQADQGKNPNHVEFPLMKTARQKRVDALKADAQEGMYVFAFERDCENPFKSRGAILWETYLHEATLTDALDSAQKIGSRYGKKQIFKLVPIDADEAIEAVGR